MRYRFIRDQQQWHSIRVLCRAMKVSRSGYYDWLKRGPSARQLEDQKLWPKIERTHYRCKEAYGSVRLRDELRVIGVCCSKHRIARLKRENRLWTKRHRRFVFTSKSDPHHARYPNILSRRFNCERADRIWVGDVTSVWTFEGWLYLAVVLDLYSRRVIGWSMGSTCKDDLTIAALQMAIQARRPQCGLLHHSDRGAHYTSAAYQQLLAQYGIRCSMSRIANCLDNAVAESFFSTLKNEQTLHERYRTRAQARAAIFEFIELFYNPVRQHSHLNGLSPMQFERQRA
jgi:transposase InsO family protein